ncbi:MAG: histidine phosphatase family protein [Erysipelotrichales bacterium]|nr:histidine phosphatase family protein [Erysipelotrichales bacterium]
MITFFYVRHGTTKGNTEFRLIGNAESPLTETGIQNAEDAAKALIDIPFTHAFYSPLSRAKDTAKTVLKYHPPVKETPLEELIEWHFGKYEYLVHPTHREEVDSRLAKGDFSDVGGETRAGFHARIREGFREMLEELEDGETVLIGSHGFFYIEMLEAIFGKEVRDEYMKDKKSVCPVPNGGISVFEYDGEKFRMKQFAASPVGWNYAEAGK